MTSLQTDYPGVLYLCLQWTRVQPAGTLHLKSSYLFCFYISPYVSLYKVREVGRVSLTFICALNAPNLFIVNQVYAFQSIFNNVFSGCVDVSPDGPRWSSSPQPPPGSVLLRTLPLTEPWGRGRTSGYYCKGPSASEIATGDVRCFKVSVSITYIGILLNGLFCEIIVFSPGQASILTCFFLFHFFLFLFCFHLIFFLSFDHQR